MTRFGVLFSFEYVKKHFLWTEQEQLYKSFGVGKPRRRGLVGWFYMQKGARTRTTTRTYIKKIERNNAIERDIHDVESFSQYVHI